MKNYWLAIPIAILALAFSGTSHAQETLQVGDQAPDFEVESIESNIKLSDRYSKKPVILLFSRANW